MLENAWSYLLPHTRSLLAAAAFFVLLEYLIPAARTQKKWRGDSALDLAYSYLLPVLLTPARMGVVLLLAGSRWANCRHRDSTRMAPSCNNPCRPPLTMAPCALLRRGR